MQGLKATLAVKNVIESDRQKTVLVPVATILTADLGLSRVSAR